MIVARFVVCVVDSRPVGAQLWCRAGVIKDSEMMLEWAAKQPTEVTTTAIDLEFLPTDTNEDRGVQNLEFVLQQMHTALMALTSCEANDIVANSPKNPLEAWRSDDRRKETKPSAHDHFSWTVLSSGNSKRRSNAGSPTRLATRRK